MEPNIELACNLSQSNWYMLESRQHKALPDMLTIVCSFSN